METESGRYALSCVFLFTCMVINGCWGSRKSSNPPPPTPLVRTDSRMDVHDDTPPRREAWKKRRAGFERQNTVQNLDNRHGVTCVCCLCRDNKCTPEPMGRLARWLWCCFRR